MKYLSIILLVFCLSSCDKSKNELPAEYSFLIGKWRCIDCNNEITISIKKDEITVDTYIGRNSTGFFKNILFSKDSMQPRTSIYLIYHKVNGGLFSSAYIEIEEGITDSILFFSNLYTPRLIKLKKE